MKPVHGTVVMGRGGFSLPNRATEVAPTLAEKVECSFFYTKLDNTNVAPSPRPLLTGERDRGAVTAPFP